MANLGTFMIFMVLAVVATLGYEFGFMAVASSDQGVNLTGSTYQEAYNYSGNTTRVAYSFMSFLPLFLGVAALIFVLLLIYFKVSGR